MPAVDAEPAGLPRLAALPAGVERPVRSVTTAPHGFEGEGFPVRRAFAGIPSRDLDPFILMDQMGEVEYAPFEPRGTDWHPHRGFETVTYLIDGVFVHQDSHGGGGVIRDGGTQWMTAGSGILHIETPPEELVVSGGLFHGVQLWVNLPARLKSLPPAYQNLEPEQVTLLTSADAGALVRLIAGSLGVHTGPGSTHTPMVMLHATLAAGSRVSLPWDRSFNALSYGLRGTGFAGVERAPFGTGQTALFGPGDVLTIEASTSAPFDVLLLGGAPIREPVVQHGPFVMNTRAEIAETFDDYRRGRFGTVPPGAITPFRPGR